MFFSGHVDARHVVAFTVGDLVAEGGDLGAIYRLGGIQARRDFGRRADLITTALPIFNGTAAVPSTVDLYVNGIRYYTGEAAPGPFQFRSLPNMGGGGTTTVVLTDALGRETVIEKPTFFSPRLLPQGMLDFSVEAGFPRLNYGSKSFDYLDEPA
ncbi:MAG TPA: fimbrial biogenesis outer membrane usher protein, partial [Croceibacterium sp.]